jgi:predicted RNA binding protein YcfA (HicA-like mRNA interferase family)
MSPRRLLHRLSTSQANVRFADLLRLARALGFAHDRTVGSHQIWIHSNRREAQLNLQPDHGQAKPYQVKQLLKLIEEYNLTLDEDS